MTSRGFAIRAAWASGLVLALAAAAACASPVQLSQAPSAVELWPQIRMLADPGRSLTLEDVLAAPQRFEPPPSGRATLGLGRGLAIWLRADLAPSSRDPRWVLDIDYPVLNLVDVYLLAEGRVVQRARLGNTVPFAERPVASRSLSTELVLEPGRQYQLLLRVETQGALILPITLNTPAAFQARALREQMLQGLLNGVGLYLLVYSLMQWLAGRETLFLKYMLLIGGSLVFSLFQFGVGWQFLWTDNFWIEHHIGPLAAIAATCGSFLFVEEVLAGPASARAFTRVMKGGAVFTLALAAVYAADLVSTAFVSAIISVLGLVPASIGIPGAMARARRRDPVGTSFLAAWGVYVLSTAVIVGVINGALPVNFWTLHSFQFGATLDMVLFMRLLGLRARAIRVAAEQARRERDLLHTMAHTDPLTGLANRRGLELQLTGALARCGEGELLALYLLDLDSFKPVNDRHGHGVGDELLLAVGRRLQAHTRSRDIVARLGGDEFVVVATGLHSEEQARALGQGLLEAFQAPFELSSVTCALGLTMGYVVAPPDGRQAAELLKLADAAMYSGKQEGKGRLRRGQR